MTRYGWRYIIESASRICGLGFTLTQPDQKDVHTRFTGKCCVATFPVQSKVYRLPWVFAWYSVRCEVVP